MADLPKISVVTPILNEERHLGRALQSICDQDYPPDRVEVLIADAGSTDGSLGIAYGYSSQLQVSIVDNSRKKYTEAGKTLALRQATGDLVLFFDADNWLASPHSLTRLTAPLIDDPSLSGAISAYHYCKELSAWTRFLSCDEFQRDPLLQALTPSIEGFIVSRGKNYDICEFHTTRIPPMGQNTLYWRSDIDLGRWDGSFREVDHPVYLIKQGLNRFAYVRNTAWAHDHCRTLRDMIRKRIRNLMVPENSFLRYKGERDFTWIDARDRREIFRLLRWVLGTNLMIPRIVEAVRLAVRLKRWEPLLGPIVAVSVTDALFFAILRSSDGREFLRGVVRDLRRGKALR